MIHFVFNFHWKPGFEMSDKFVSIFLKHDVGSEPILILYSKLNSHLPPLIKATQANFILTENPIFSGIDKQVLNYRIIASSLSCPMVLTIDHLNDTEIEQKERAV